MTEVPIHIAEVKEAEKNLLTRLNSLFRQLTPSYKKMHASAFEEIISSQQTRLYVATSQTARNKVFGTLSMVIYRIPTGLNARIEDVVVDEAKRGLGIGRQLMRYAIAEAEKAGVSNVSLTSSPFRVAANKLYQALGFELRETNVYRLKLK